MSASPPTIYWEDACGAGELTLGTTTVSRKDILEYGNRYDPNPFHVDEDAARASIHGGLIASGFHICSLVIRVMCDGYLLRTANLGSPGIDELRWIKPARPGDTLTVKQTVLESRLTSKPDRGLIKYLIAVQNQRGEMVMTMKVVNLFKRRGT